MQYLLGAGLTSGHTVPLTGFFQELCALVDPGSKMFLITWQAVTLVIGWPICCSILFKKTLCLKWIKIDNSISRGHLEAQQVFQLFFPESPLWGQMICY